MPRRRSLRAMLAADAPPPALWPRFTGRLRSVALTARLGRALGIAFGVCFLTGLISHYQYAPLSAFAVPATPSWLYRLTQGIHVITGIASIPLLLVKLWSVVPRLFEWPPVRSVPHALERLSIAVLVSSALLEVFSGFANVLNWYPWPWSFLDVHHWLAWVVAGSVLLHLSVKLPLVKTGLAEPLPQRAVPGRPVNGISRRGVLIATASGVGIVAATTVGQTVTPLAPISWLAPRRPRSGPQGVPINRTAAQADVRTSAMAASYRLTVLGPTPYELDLAALEALPRVDRDLPIACVEGWSIGARWSGPLLLDLVRRAGGDHDHNVTLVSLERAGSYRASTISGPQLKAALLATHLNGQRLDLDHGYPARLIAPDRAGVFNTKWVTRIEVAR